MFCRCKIAVTRAQAGKDAATYEITLFEPTGYSLKDVVTIWGLYKSDANNILPNRKCWIWSHASRELRLTDNGDVGMVGGGLEFGERAPVPPFAIFSGAILTDRGIEPWPRSNAAPGQLNVGAALDMAVSEGPVTWCLSRYRRSPSTYWEEA